jgi:hypothetical protein
MYERRCRLCRGGEPMRTLTPSVFNATPVPFSRLTIRALDDEPSHHTTDRLESSR